MSEAASPRSWAREMAEKIRAHEAANIDEGVEQRSAAMEALVRKSLAAVPPALRAAYLEELDTHFPAPAPAALPAQPEAAPDETAAAAIRRRLPELGVGERNEVLRQLLNTAFRDWQPDTRLSRLLLEAVRKSNPSSGTPPAIDPERMLRLLEFLSEGVLALQRLVIELWREVGARKLPGTPPLVSEAELRLSLARSLAGDPDVPATLIEQEIERQRRAVAAAMAMLGPFAETYGQAVLKPFAPEAIAARAPADSFSMFGSREAGYWKQFCRTWESIGDEHFQSIFLESLAKHLRTLHRSNP